MADCIGQHFGNYRLLHLLGQGSFADVYLGKHMYLKTEAAIKVLYGRLDAEAVEKFLTEARLLRELEHPHIIRIHDVGMEGSTPFLVMDYAPGGTLREHHPKRLPLPLGTILAYVQQIASALDYAHEHKLIHRDLKPENLLLGPRQEVLLSDFGVALPMRNTDSISVQAVGGTLAYMAPEQIRGKPKAASDQYALAIMIYEWLSGQRPFHGEVAELCGQHLFVSPPSFYERLPDGSLLVEQVLFKALAKDPRERFEHVGAFAQALEQASRGVKPASLATISSGSIRPVGEAFSLSEAPPGPGNVLPEVSAPPTPAEAPRKRARLTRLPAQLTTLMGRDDERKAACVMLVRPEVRLLTITGPGGIGKTRLALAIATDLLHVFIDGVCFVPLAAVNDPDEVLPALIRASGMQERGDLPLLATLKDFLRERHLLLLFDNFEQVIDAAPLLMDLLQECPDLTMLVTSRILLHIPGEHTFPLSPLSCPDLKEVTDPETLLQYASVKLFVERVHEVRPDFQVTEANTPVIAEICTRLDGLPLALELAAARVKSLSPQTLLARLAHRLDLLGAPGSAVVSLRQQTIRNTIQWSYDLLTIREQVLFQRLAIFVGGFGVEDAEAIYAQLGESQTFVLDTITELLDKSLIYQIAQQEEPRFQMLETIREYGLECLGSGGLLERVREAHAHYYHQLLPEPEPVALGLAQGQRLALIKREYENLRTALRTLEERREIELALQLVVSMGGIWFVSGYEREGREELLRVLALVPEQQTQVSPLAKATALYLAGRVAMGNLYTQQAIELMSEGLQLCRSLSDTRYLLQMLSSLAFAESDLGDYSAADAHYAEGVRLFQATNERNTARRVLMSYGASKFGRGQFEATSKLCEESLSIARCTGDLWVMASNLHYLGWVAYCQGSYETAHSLGKEGVKLFRQMDFPTFGLEALSILAYETAATGDIQQAQELFEEALQLSRKVQDTQAIALALCGLGHLSLRRSNLTQARMLFEESILTIQKVRSLVTRYRYIPACALEGLAEMACAQEEWTRAIRLMGTANALRSLGTYFSPIGQDQQACEQTHRAGRAELGEAYFTRIFKEGHTLTAAQALAIRSSTEVLEQGCGEEHTKIHVAQPTRTTENRLLSGAQETTPGPATADDMHLVENLTRREMDVLRLLAEGESNAEIAEELMLSIVTVNSYLRSIYRKLGVSSRLRAVRWAMEYHLI